MGGRGARLRRDRLVVAVVVVVIPVVIAGAVVVVAVVKAAVAEAVAFVRLAVIDNVLEQMIAVAVVGSLTTFLVVLCDLG